jgi:hypothetical protein
MNLGSGAKVGGAGRFPAKYSFRSTTSNCSDWVAYNIVAGVGTVGCTMETSQTLP